ncbi:uncharacterized protein LOC119224824 isoform X1 [Pungitius pungitius]|uniref:uncharacterized protein LOC119224824 isoform X1 n=2 Tax=Pungitius pungitius TaxID=134920 RepID=UPI002E128EF5
MMDNLASNESHAPCQSWGAQNGWSNASTPGPLLNPLPGPQHLGLGSSPDPTPSYDHLRESNQSCMSDARHAALYKASLITGGPPSNALFAPAPAAPPLGSSRAMSFPQQAPHAPVTLFHATQPPQPRGPPLLPLFSPHDPYKAPFQHALSNQSLPNGLLPVGVAPCGRRASAPRAAFDGMQVEFSGVAPNAHSRASSTPQEQSQWTPSSHCRGAGEISIPVTAPHPENQLSQEGRISAATNNERQRQVLLLQRAQLLQQVAELDKLLESIPPEENESPHEALQSPPSMEASSQGEQSEASDARQLPLSEGKSKSELSSGCSSPASRDEQSEASDTPDDQMSAVESKKEESESAHDSDSDFSDFLSDSDWGSSDESSPSAPAAEEPPPPDLKGGESGSSLAQEESVSPPKKIRPTNPRNSFETVVLPSSSSKSGRVYDRRNYCLFCKNPLSKMSRHLEKIHSDKPEVAAVFQHPKKSRERNKIWNRLINQGNFAHNKEVLKTGRGQLVSRKRPSTTQRAQDFLHCLYCRGLFMKKALHRHVKSCPEKEANDASDEPEPGRRRLALRCVLETLEDLGISDGFKGIISTMVFDDVTQGIMADGVILQYGEELFAQQGADPKKHQCIRQNLRQMARLVQEARRTTPLRKLEDFFLPSAFPHVVSAVNALAGYDPERKTYALPSLAIKLGHNLQKTCAIAEGNAAGRGDAAAAEAARSFLAAYRERWNALVSGAALTSLRETKLAKDKKVPFARDVKRLNSHMEAAHLVAEKNLREAPTAENYASLAKVTLARTLLFNRRSVSEVSSVELSAFESRGKSGAAADDDGAALSDLERNMCEFFARVDVRGSTGRMVPVFLKPSFVAAMELLVAVRKKCGVLRQNPYVFGRPQTLSAYSAAECVRRFVKGCGAEDPEALTTAKIRRHYGPMLQLINLDEDEAAQILGPNSRVQSRLREDSGPRPDAEMDSDDLCPKKAPKATTEGNATPLLKSDKEGYKYRGKHKWAEEEVLAVERHMKRLIEAHKVPQKFDCFQCLEAEPKALKMRSWKGVKDYVRNRITALKRQGRTPKAPS